jgi:hypothetical protein
MKERLELKRCANFLANYLKHKENGGNTVSFVVLRQES